MLMRLIRLWLLREKLTMNKIVWVAVNPSNQEEIEVKVDEPYGSCYFCDYSDNGDLYVEYKRAMLIIED